jgi:hypothetical protein
MGGRERKLFIRVGAHLITAGLAVAVTACTSTTTGKPAAATSTTPLSAPTVTNIGRSAPAPTTTTVAKAPKIALPVGLYIITVQAVSPPDDQMTFGVTSSCGKPSSGLYRISLGNATFDINSNPGTDMGQETTISKSDFFRLAGSEPPSNPANADFWKRWHILVPPSSPIQVSDGPYGDCHGAYSFLP